MEDSHNKGVSAIFDLVIWFTVFENCKIEDMQDAIAKALDLNLGSSSKDIRKMQLSARLKNKKFLLILDGMRQSINLMDAVGVKFGDGKGSKVLISSRRKDVIGRMGANELCLRIEPLSTEEAWELFKSKAFTNRADPEKHIEAMAREIASECGGLPLAINEVAGAMACNKTGDDWSRALVNHKNSLGTIDAQLYVQLRYSYDDLPDNLKMCFLYCAASPGVRIDVETMVEIWIADSLVDGSGIISLMDVGYGYMDQLVNMGLMEYVGVEQKLIEVHQVLRGMAVHIGRDEQKWLFATGQHLPNLRQRRDCKRISLRHNDIDALLIDLKFPNLVSLVLASNTTLMEVPESFFFNVASSLRVLDLSHTGIKCLPISVEQLEAIEFLNLTDCRQISELPTNIGKLSHLQFLNLTDCSSLKVLPSSISNLKKLKHLKLRGCQNLKEISVDISQLTLLHKLVLPLKLDGDKRIASPSYAMRAMDFTNLSFLSELEAEIMSGTLPNWIDMRNLTLQYMHDRGANSVDGMKDILPEMENMKQLQRFSLINCNVESLPSCICKLQNLRKLELNTCLLLREIPQIDIKSASDGFPMLETLILSRCPLLKTLPCWNLIISLCRLDH